MLVVVAEVELVLVVEIVTLRLDLEELAVEELAEMVMQGLQEPLT
tara:strand:- start:24 stop:158 length:135 start_codon:yes stop_codon:yes gene_type:complete